MSNPIIDAIKNYLFNHFSYDRESIIVSPVKKSAYLQGQWVKDTRPIWVKDSKGKRLLVIKLVSVSDHDSWKFSNLENSIIFFNRLNLKNSQTIAILGSQRILTENISLDVCAMNPAKGKELYTFFRNVSPENNSFEILHHLTGKWAKILAELHLAKVKKVHCFPKEEREKNRAFLSRILLLMKKYPNLLPFKKNKLIKRVENMGNSAAKKEIHLGITHGDPNPTNIIYDHSSKKWTFIDIDHLITSVDSRGNPIACIGNEFVHARESLVKVIFFQKLSHETLMRIVNNFEEHYKQAVGANFPTLEQRNFYFLLYLIEKISWISALEESLIHKLNRLPNHFKNTKKYQKYLIQNLQELV